MSTGICRIHGKRFFSYCADSCMRRWLNMSGISRSSAIKYEEVLKLLKADEKTYPQTSPRLFAMLFTDAPKHGTNFLRCMSKWFFNVPPGHAQSYSFIPRKPYDTGVFQASVVLYCLNANTPPPPTPPPPPPPRTYGRASAARKPWKLSPGCMHIEAFSPLLFRKKKKKTLSVSFNIYQTSKWGVTDDWLFSYFLPSKKMVHTLAICL